MDTIENTEPDPALVEATKAFLEPLETIASTHSPQDALSAVLSLRAWLIEKHPVLIDELVFPVFDIN